ncbi:hypothetical protein OKW41_001070 [Paraburkholderia sp. UCT70]
MNELEWRSRPMQVRVLDRCDECGELKEGVQKRTSYFWPETTAVCCAKCFAEITGGCSGFAACHGSTSARTFATQTEHQTALGAEFGRPAFAFGPFVKM